MYQCVNVNDYDYQNKLQYHNNHYQFFTPFSFTSIRILIFINTVIGASSSRKNLLLTFPTLNFEESLP